MHDDVIASVQAQPGPGPDTATGSPRLRVLFVGADEGDVFYARAVLAGHGGDEAFAIEHVTSLADATARLSRMEIDVALIDLELPDARGPGVVQSLRNANPRLPIVVLLGAGETALGVPLVRLGADDFQRKGEVSGEGLANMLELAVERRRSLLEPMTNVAEPVVVIADTGEVRMANRAAETLLGRAESELLGARLPLELPDGDEVEVCFENAAGQRVCEVRRRRLRWHEQPAELLSFRDVTDRRAAAELRRRLEHADKLASVGQMAAGVAHEVNNPAMAIKASLELLGERALGPQERELVDSGSAAVDRIHRIVQALSSFSRLEEAQVGTVDMREVIELACRLTANEIRHRGRLELELEPLRPVRGDRDRLTQVLINLLVNAAHAIDGATAREPRVTVEACVEDATVVVRVRDTGVGIPARELGRVFEPFYTTKRAGLGTGLGLSLVSDIVRQHGGRIAASSVVGEGTVMELRLPAAAREDATRSAGEPGDAREPAARMRILLIDDDDLVRRSCARLLKSRHEVVEACSAEDALEMLAEDDAYDVILSDIMMPGLDGPALYERAGELFPHLAQRFGFFTGGAFTPRSRAFCERDDIVVVPKPITKQALMQSISAIAARR